MYVIWMYSYALITGFSCKWGPKFILRLKEQHKTRLKWMHKFSNVDFSSLTGEKIFTFVVLCFGIEQFARLWADDNSWPSSCQRGEAKQGQKALSQLQTSAWCRRHQSSADDTSSERAGEGGGGTARGMTAYLSLPFSSSSYSPLLTALIPPNPPSSCSSSSQLSVGVCCGTALCHTH